MAFQRVPNSAEIVIKYTLNSEPMFNVLHAELPGGYLLADLQALANAVDVGIGLWWLDQQTLDATYNETLVRGLDQENDQIASSVVNAGPGASLTEALPGNVTVSIKKASAFTGRSARGRVYWIGIPSGQLTANENVLGGAYVAALVTAVNEVRKAIDATAWTPVIVSRFNGGVKRLTAVTFDWITTSSVNDNVDSSRRRLA